MSFLIGIVTFIAMMAAAIGGLLCFLFAEAIAREIWLRLPASMRSERLQFPLLLLVYAAAFFIGWIAVLLGYRH